MLLQGAVRVLLQGTIARFCFRCCGMLQNIMTLNCVGALELLHASGTLDAGHGDPDNCAARDFGRMLQVASHGLLGVVAGC